VSEPIWIKKATILAAHAEVLAEYGGLEGIRDEGLLESALARPRNVFTYGGVNDFHKLAAFYAIGIAHNHPFVDGNKRAAFIAMALFLAANGLRLTANQVDATNTFLEVAAGKLNEDELTAWIQKNTSLRRKP
jgi:death-on-curing protein